MRRPRAPIGAILACVLLAAFIVIILNVINRAIWRASNIFALLVEIILIAIIVFGFMAIFRKTPRA